MVIFGGCPNFSEKKRTLISDLGTKYNATELNPNYLIKELWIGYLKNIADEEAKHGGKISGGPTHVMWDNLDIKDRNIFADEKWIQDLMVSQKEQLEKLEQNVRIAEFNKVMLGGGSGDGY